MSVHVVLLSLGIIFVSNSLVISWVLIFQKIPKDSTGDAETFLIISAVVALFLLIGAWDNWPSAIKTETVTEEEKEEK